MNRKRMRRAIAILDRVHAENLPFDIGQWVSEPDNPYDCGTAACAAGWMARDAEFRAEGLVLTDESCVSVGFPAFELDVGFLAMAKFLDIDYDESCQCFDECYYDGDTPPTAADVAARMRALMKKKPRASAVE